MCIWTREKSDAHAFQAKFTYAHGKVHQFALLKKHVHRGVGVARGHGHSGFLEPIIKLVQKIYSKPRLIRIFAQTG